MRSVVPHTTATLLALNAPKPEASTTTVDLVAGSRPVRRTLPSAAVTAVFDTRLSGELTLTVAPGIGWPTLPLMVMRRTPVSAAIAAPTKHMPQHGRASGWEESWLYGQM